MKSHIDEQNEESEGLWITSYADLISALLAVLVLFVSFSSIDTEKFEAAMIVNQDSEIETLEQLKDRILSEAFLCGVADKISLNINQQGLNVDFNTVALFQPARADFEPDELNNVGCILEIIAETGNLRYIDIAGHTDDIPLVRGDESNWSLSAGRAVSIHRYLLSLGMPQQGSRLIAYADTQPMQSVAQLGDELALENARAKNRRVSIQIGLLKTATN